LGKGPATRYIGRRAVREVPRDVPIYEITAQGTTERFGILSPAGDSGFCVQRPGGEISYFGDLPYFLDTLRLQGFLGRTIAQNHQELMLPSDVRNWSADHCLRYLVEFGWDSVGNFILGDGAFRRYLDERLKAPEFISKSERPAAYEERADQLLERARVGSSAGGEQPKFLATIGQELREVLVKFSPPHVERVGRRIADLLIAEHLASQVLSEHGVSAVSSEIVLGRARTFLEVERFDRIRNGDAPPGRRGVLSLEALDLEHWGDGSRTDWGGVCRKLETQAQIPKGCADSAEFLTLFGQLIANTDMHGGNLSFLTSGTQVLELAPVYDMLPMLYVPLQGNVVTPSFQPNIRWEMTDRAVLQAASAAALVFWRRFAEDARVSRDMRKIADENHKIVERIASIDAFLPA
jgi:HipA-like C-terminal domain